MKNDRSCNPNLMKSSLSFLSGICALVMTATVTQAQVVYSYQGGNGTWSAPANWSPATSTAGPTTTDTADIDYTGTGTQIVTYDSAASGTLATLNLTQSSGTGTDELLLAKALTVTSAITLGSSTGLAELALGTTTTGFNLTDSSGITIDSGGELATGSGETITGPLTINAGGTLDVLGASNPALTISGDFTLEGTVINTTFGTYNSTSSALELSGAINILAPTNSVVFKNVALTGSGTTSTTAQINTLYVRAYNGSTQTFSSTFSGTQIVGNIYWSQQTRGSGTDVFKLGSNLSSNGTVDATGNIGTLAGTGSMNFGLDTAGYTLDFSTSVSSFDPSNSSNATNWNLEDSTNTTGKIIAKNFILSTTTGNVSVSNTLTLQAVGGSGNLNNDLGGTGTISAASTFLYTGTSAASAAATLISNRTIGQLQVQNGFLNLNQASLTTGGSVSVNTNGGLILDGTAGTTAGSLVMATGNLTFTLASGGTLDLKLGNNGTSNINDEIFANGGTGSNGTFNLNGGVINLLTGSLGTFDYGSYQLFGNFLTSGNTVTGETIELNGAALDGYTASISQSGLLTFEAVPEPPAWALLPGGMALLALLRYRRRLASIDSV